MAMRTARQQVQSAQNHRLCNDVRDGLLEAALNPKAATLGHVAGRALVAHERGLSPRTRHKPTWAKRGALDGTGARPVSTPEHL
jgi:hypothetical protein